MRDWMKRAGRAVLMGIMWATAWAPIGPIVGNIIDPTDKMDEPWLIASVLPGFLCGIIFSVTIALAERGRRFADLSLARIAVWGGVAGLVVGFLPFVLGDASGGGSFSWKLLLIPLAIGVAGAVSSAGTLMLARKAELNFVDDQPVA